MIHSEEEVMRAFLRLYDEHGIPPTVSEVMDEIEAGSTSVAYYWLRKCIQQGWLKQPLDGVSRGIVPTSKGRKAVA